MAEPSRRRPTDTVTRPQPTRSPELRAGCCANWPKPCSYHEGYLDGLEAATRTPDSEETP